MITAYYVLENKQTVLEKNQKQYLMVVGNQKDTLVGLQN